MFMLAIARMKISEVKQEALSARMVSGVSQRAATEWTARMVSLEEVEWTYLPS